MIEHNVLLKRYSNFRIGGPARRFVRAQSLVELADVVAAARREELPILVMGSGTNLLISDEGFAGLVIKPEFDYVQHHDVLFKVGAGALVSDALNTSIAKGLAGLEWAGGLPGTIGGAIRGNAGAFGGEIKDVVRDVMSLSLAEGGSKIIKRTAAECHFGYRNSVFKENGNEIILEATLTLASGDPLAIARVAEEKIAFRQQRHPLEHPNIGSIFKNIDWQTVPIAHQETFKDKMKIDPFPVLPTAVLIDRCGLKGVSCGGAMISPKHPNFIVNTIGATADDVHQLIGLVKDSVKDKFGITLEEEVQYV